MVLTLFFATVSGIITALLWAGGLNPWWILPVWIGFYIAAVLVFLLLLVSGSFLFLPKDNLSPRTKRVNRVIIRLVLHWLLLTLGIRVKLIDANKLPNTPYLLVGNHRSAFDPICTVAVLSPYTVFVAKPGVLKIPVIGSLMERFGFMGIDRENARNAVTTIKLAAQRIQEAGACVGIYPEGTRSKDGNLLPFHAGSFKIAKMANCPVAVATIRYEKRGLLPWNKRVYIRIVDVMDEAFVTKSNTAAMSKRAEAAIRTDLRI
ncbi:MAG: 1-acyl-sn-glycerol-3-phosphate acyltransferase [Clostridia bacterium]|nr:1-acyl-sn-glycerol-3-phosphate acyltransferase [Clostridia bacterium]